MAKRANKSPIINRSNGEKLAICSFAFVVKFVMKSVGNSIMYKSADGRTSNKAQLLFYRFDDDTHHPIKDGKSEKNPCCYSDNR